MTTDELTATIAIPANNWLSAIQPPNLEKQIIVDVAARLGVKDNREQIDNIRTAIEGGVHFIGKTSTELYDGDEEHTTIALVGGSSSYQAMAGDMVIKQGVDEHAANESEFIFNGTAWYELGSINAMNLGDLAFKDSVSASYTPDGTVTVNSTENSSAALTGTISMDQITPTGSVSINGITPAGTISVAEFTPTGSFSGTAVTPTGTVDVTEVSSATFAGTEKTLTASFSGSEQTLTCNATLPNLPTITVTKPNVTVDPSTTVAGTASVSNGVLSFSFNTVVSSLTAALDATPAASYNGEYNTALSGTATMTPSGSVEVESFTPAGNVSLGTKTAEKTLALDSITPSGSVSINAVNASATFTGTPVTPTGSITVDAFTPTGSVSGNVTIPGHSHTGSFSGTAATITAS